MQVLVSRLTSFHFQSSHCDIAATKHTPKRIKLQQRIKNPPASMEEAKLNDENALETLGIPAAEESLSKNAQKKLVKQQRYEVRKAEKKAAEKERRKKEVERKRREWDEKLAGVAEEERCEIIESRKNLRKERMEKRSEEKELKIQRLTEAKISGQNIIIDLEFSHLMTPSEINSLVQQIMYCYAVNSRHEKPSHLWLTGCAGDTGSQFQRIPGFDRWVIEKEDRSYIDALQDRKDDLVYLTADSETVLDDLDPSKMYIVGGLVDRNRWKGVTMKKAQEQGIRTAKLPIGNYLKMSSSQVLTVNQVMEILLKFMETKDWKSSFFQVIPPRKRGEADAEKCKEGNLEEEDRESTGDLLAAKRQCVEVPPSSLD